jgi:hypothetical protein
MKYILAFLLHHANRCTKSPEFYRIKDKLLDKYGSVVGYDVQHIEGKECFSCGGTGIHYKRDQYGIRNSEGCWRCHGGWYRRPMWILLARKPIGKYVFHKPAKREYSVKNPFIPALGDKVIDGYIRHRVAKYSHIALYALYLLYNRPMFRRYFLENVGVGCRVYWYWPRNWFYHLVYLIRGGWRREIHELHWKNFILFTPYIDIVYLDEHGNIDLPF